MHQNQERIPNYTCLETITRARRPSPKLVLNAKGGRGRFLRYDIVRVEVAEVDGKEFFAWPGARNLSETELSTFITGGMIGNGVFTLFARGISNPAIASYQFAGISEESSRHLLRYKFQIALLSSGYRLKTLQGEATVAFSGLIWADAKTLDTVRLDIQADDIPPELGLTAATTRIDYGPVHIGSVDVLLPQSAEMTVRRDDGSDDRNTINFTHCKEYGASSVVSFEAPNVVPSAAPLPIGELEIPAGLSLATRLDTALDSSSASPGDLVHARVEADIKHKGVVVIPKDTIVTGHIRRFDQYLVPTRHFVIALEFYRFEFVRGPVRFFASLQKMVTPESRAGLTMVATPELPGVATFSVKGNSVLLAPGTRMMWRTSRYSPGSP
jgi:hypothetical protein